LIINGYCGWAKSYNSGYNLAVCCNFIKLVAVITGAIMKKHLLITSLVLIMASPVASANLELAKKSGCLACHSVEKKVVGPAWKDVAAKYKGNAEMRAKLLNKVKTGGKGNWGQVPMPPYSPRVSDADIETLVDFVLNL